MTTTSTPSAVVGTVRNGAAFTIQVTNGGPTEAFGVVLTIARAKGTKITFPSNCFVLGKSTGAIQCMMGYLAPLTSQQLDFKITSTKAGTYNTSFAASSRDSTC